MTDKGVKGLSEGLGHLTLLKNLRISLHGYD